MPSSYALLSLLPLVYALKSPIPAPTDKSADEAGILSGSVPRPTPAPSPAWRYGAEFKHALFARQATLTCGFFDADPSRPNLCGRGSECLFATPAYYFGCCTTTGGCATPLSCSTYDGGNNAGPVLNDNGDAVLCGSQAPQCQTTVFPTVRGLNDEGPYTHFDCVTSALPIQTLYQDTTGPPGLKGNNATGTSAASSTIRGGGGGGSGNTVTVMQTVSVVVTPPASSSTTTPSSQDSSSAGTMASGQASSTTGGAVPQRTAAAAGILALALAAGRMLV